MIILTVEEILYLHELMIHRYGGSDGLRDRGLLESAVYSVDAAFGDTERYPSVEEKAARLAYGLINDHAFLDGNKRIGILAMMTMLRLNNVSVSSSMSELTCLGLGIAEGRYGYEDILSWINLHKQ